MKSQRGVTLLEFIIAMTVFALISVLFVNALKVSKDIWVSGTKVLGQVSQTQSSGQHVVQAIRSLKSIQQLSLVSDLDGFIQFVNDSNQQISIYKNSHENQLRFGENSLTTNTVVMQFSDQRVEPLFSDVSTFNIVAFGRPKGRDLDIGNGAYPIDYSSIKSIKFNISRLSNNREIVTPILVVLHQNRVLSEGHGQIRYGVTLNALIHDYPFQANDFEEYPGFTVKNMYFCNSDDPGVDADLVCLSSKNIGSITSPFIISDQYRQYSQLRVTAKGGGFNRSNNDRLSELAVVLDLDGESVTLSPSMVLMNDIEKTHVWELGAMPAAKMAQVVINATCFGDHESLYITKIVFVY